MDPQLVDRAKRGDRDAFTAIVVGMGDRLYSVAYRILRDAGRAEDAVQQAFLIAWRELPKLRDESRLEAWLYRLLVNECYSEARHTRRWQPGLRLVSNQDLVPDTTDEQAGIEIRDQLERGFRSLSGEQRAVLVMHHYLGLSGAEIAEALGISAGTVRSRLHYARQQLRAAIDAEFENCRFGGNRMTQGLDMDRLLTDWLAEGPDQLPERVVAAITQEVRDIPQPRIWWLPGRALMNRKLLPIATGFAALAIVLAGATYIFGPGIGVGGSVGYVSPRHSYSVRIPNTWTVNEIPGSWLPGRVFDYLGQGSDQFVDPANPSIVRFVNSQPIAAGTTFEQWVADYDLIHNRFFSNCRNNLSVEERTFAGEPARISTADCTRTYTAPPDAASLLVMHNGRGYAFRVLTDGPEDEVDEVAVLLDWLRTLRFT